MEKISQDVLDKFQSITKIDLKQFFVDYVQFIELYYPRMVEYYTGLTKVSNATAFNTYKTLWERCVLILDQFVANDSSLNDYQFWVLLEQVEDIQSQLLTTGNLDRWLRSNQINDGFSPTPRLPYVAKQNQSLEEIQASVIGSENPKEDWVQTALDNNLREEDYTLNGGYLIKINFKNNDTIILQSVIDRIDSIEKSYGLDIDCKLSLIDDDLRVLTYRDTLLQSAEINASLKKGDNPTFPDDGLDTKRVVGGTVAGITYPTIFRQMAAVFAKDDTFKSFSVLDVRKVQDAIYIDFSLETRAGDVLKRTTKL